MRLIRIELISNYKEEYFASPSSINLPSILNRNRFKLDTKAAAN